MFHHWIHSDDYILVNTAIRLLSSPLKHDRTFISENKVRKVFSRINHLLAPIHPLDFVRLPNKLAITSPFANPAQVFPVSLNGCRITFHPEFRMNFCRQGSGVKFPIFKSSLIDVIPGFLAQNPGPSGNRRIRIMSIQFLLGQKEQTKVIQK